MTPELEAALQKIDGATRNVIQDAFPSGTDVRQGVGEGTLVVPSASDVRKDAVVDATVGTLAVPVAADVRIGVPVDATVGTLVVAPTPPSPVVPLEVWLDPDFETLIADGKEAYGTATEAFNAAAEKGVPVLLMVGDTTTLTSGDRSIILSRPWTQNVSLVGVSKEVSILDGITFQPADLYFKEGGEFLDGGWAYFNGFWGGNGGWTYDGPGLKRTTGLPVGDANPYNNPWSDGTPPWAGAHGVVHVSDLGATPYAVLSELGWYHKTVAWDVGAYSPHQTDSVFVDSGYGLSFTGPGLATISASALRASGVLGTSSSGPLSGYLWNASIDCRMAKVGIGTISAPSLLGIVGVEASVTIVAVDCAIGLIDLHGESGVGDGESGRSAGSLTLILENSSVTEVNLAGGSGVYGSSGADQYANNGANGTDGADGSATDGTDGGAGADGTEESPDGVAGQNGSDASTTDGGGGGRGEDAPAGCGGTGVSGGNGGNGGAFTLLALEGSTCDSVNVQGGSGANAGNGGYGQAGNAGYGGNGGAGVSGAGGDGGAGGNAYPGGEGVGGVGGNGGSGQSGTPGAGGDGGSGQYGWGGYGGNGGNGGSCGAVIVFPGSSASVSGTESGGSAGSKGWGAGGSNAGNASGGSAGSQDAGGSAGAGGQGGLNADEATRADNGSDGGVNGCGNYWDGNYGPWNPSDYWPGGDGSDGNPGSGSEISELDVQTLQAFVETLVEWRALL